MPIRIKVPEKSQNIYIKRRRQRVIYACATSAAIIIIASIILISVKIFLENKQVENFITYVPPVDDVSIPKPKDSLAGGSSPDSAPIDITIATDTSDVNLDSVDIFGDSTDFGTIGLGDGMGGGLGNEPTAEPTHGMGNREKAQSAFYGRFWDLKKLRNGKESPFMKSISRNVDTLKLLSKFYNDKWKTQFFDKYFESPVKLYASCFYMPFSPDTEACQAYDPTQKMGLEPSRWVAVYTARVKAPKSGKFRFVAAGDSLIAVRFNDKNVLATGIHNLDDALFYGMGNDAYREGKDFYEYTSCEPWNYSGDDGNGLYGFQAGTPFTVEQGQWYEMEVMVSEIGGGYFGFCLLIDDMDDPGKPTSKDGLPVFQLFRTMMVAPTAEESYENLFNKLDKDEGRTDPPYDADSNVWPAEAIIRKRM